MLITFLDNFFHTFCKDAIVREHALANVSNYSTFQIKKIRENNAIKVLK